MLTAFPLQARTNNSVNSHAYLRLHWTITLLCVALYRYVRSLVSSQLGGENKAPNTLGQCAPQQYVANTQNYPGLLDQGAIDPCGLMAFSYFNDSFTLAQGAEATPLSLDVSICRLLMHSAAKLTCLIVIITLPHSPAAHNLFHSPFGGLQNRPALPAPHCRASWHNLHVNRKAVQSLMPDWYDYSAIDTLMNVVLCYHRARHKHCTQMSVMSCRSPTSLGRQIATACTATTLRPTSTRYLSTEGEGPSRVT